MRLFIAIDLEEIKDYFKELQKQIPEDTAIVKKVNTFHLTLKFLGDMEEPHLDKIKQALAKVQFKQFKISIDNIGFFPSESYIRVIWIGFKQNKSLTNLQKQIEKVLEEFVFRKDFEFLPHLTLARVKFIKDKEKFMKKLNSIKPKEKSVEITNFKLIKSELTREGPNYTDLGIYKA